MQYDKHTPSNGNYIIIYTKLKGIYFLIKLYDNNMPLYNIYLVYISLVTPSLSSSSRHSPPGVVFSGNEQGSDLNDMERQRRLTMRPCGTHMTARSAIKGNSQTDPATHEQIRRSLKRSTTSSDSNRFVDPLIHTGKTHD